MKKLQLNPQHKALIGYHLVIDFIETKDGIIPNGYDTRIFKTKSEARKCWLNEYKNRKENDGYDKYWNNKPFICMKQTVTQELI